MRRRQISGAPLILCLVAAKSSTGFVAPLSSTTPRTTGLTTTPAGSQPGSPLPFSNSNILYTQPYDKSKIGSSSSLSAGPSSLISYEKLQEKLPSKAVLDAVEKKAGSKVIASDIAAQAGVSLSQARKDLTALASLSQGDISVSDDGELLYEFPANLNSVLSQNSAKFKASQTFEKIWPTLFWGIRVSFGVALVASVVAIYSTIFFVQTSSSSSDDDRRRDDRRGGGMSFNGGFGGIWGPSPFDFFYYRPYGYYGYYSPNNERDPTEMGFLESVFSYIFGDGNPNQDIEERRLQLVAKLIRDNNGAVTAEQLAPFLDAPAPDLSKEGTYVDESFVLPIVTQLEGEPQVTEDGDIVYTFPDLQVSTTSAPSLPAATTNSMTLRRAGLPPNASAREIQQFLYMNGVSTRGIVEKQALIQKLDDALPPMTPTEEAELLLSDPSVLQEREYKFSLAPDLYKVFAGGLGVVNLGGALYLGNLMKQYAAYGIQLPGWLGLVQAGYPLLLGYAILFNIIPLVRNAWIGRQNAAIQERNSSRKKWKAALQSKTTKLKNKLRAAARFATGRKQLKSQDIIYDTKQSTDQLAAQQNQKELDEFDKLLNDDSSSFQ